MSDFLFIDFETRSEVDLEVRGLWNYATDRSTQVLMLAYALNKAETRLWQAHLEPFPSELSEMLDDPFVLKVAWNAPFERHIFRHVMKRDIPLDEFLDPVIYARHLSLPGYLEDASVIMGLEEPKMSWGTKKNPGEAQRLIRMFCQPASEAKEESLFGAVDAVFRDWNTDPEDWKKFCEYCIKDVDLERDILRKLINKYPLPDIERRGWIVDQVINERGVYVDRQLVSNALHMADQVKYSLDLRMKKITGLDNPNAPKKLMEWAKNQGYTFNSMGKVWIQRAIDEKQITPECAEVFKLRQQSSKTSWTKFEAIQNIVGSDNRIRNQFAFLGASRTGRWSGHDTQLHNLPRGSKEVEKKFDLAVQLLRAGKYDEINRQFSNQMDVISALVRPALCAAPGKKLLISDESAIENRGIGWITSCREILEVFEKGLDPYIDFATKMFKKPYSIITKDQRQTAKPAVLGAGYRLSGGEEAVDKWENPIKTGLWGYCTQYGVEMTRDEAHYAVEVFRKEYKKVVNFWYELEEVSMAVVMGSKPLSAGPLTFEMRDKILMMHLPSGRRLHYIHPRVEDREFFGRMKPTLVYEGKQPITKIWGDITTHGGHLLENATQAISRDFLLNGMFEAERRGLPIVLHVHDEIVAEVDECSTLSIKDLKDCMEVRPKWALDFPLVAEGFESQYYKKA